MHNKDISTFSANIQKMKTLKFSTKPSAISAACKISIAAVNCRYQTTIMKSET